MAKLKCDQHKRRVIALKGHFIHRGGWGDVCKSPTATIGVARYTAAEIEQAEQVRTPSDKKWLSLRKSEVTNG